MPRVFSNPLNLPSIRSPSALRPLQLRKSFSSTPHLASIPSTPSLLTIKNIRAPHTGHIRIISLNSPRNRNALSRQLLAELGTEIAKLGVQEEGMEGVREADKREGGEHGARGLTRCLVLASELDSVFCSGADLKERREMTKEDTLDFLTSLRQTFNNLSSIPIPSISAVSSIALGGGLELALASTFRVFSASATVGFPECRLAIIPGAGGTYRLRRLIGEAKAMELILTGRYITGAQAWELGICEKLVPVHETAPKETTDTGRLAKRKAVLDAALETAIQICNGAPGVLGPAMRAVKAGNEKTENQEYESILDMEDRMEALNAFYEKRQPVFRGR